MNPIRHNDWHRIQWEDSDAAPALGVSVIIPCYQTLHALERTLASLEHQSWPRELLEVVVVDDGSNPPLRIAPQPELDLRLLRQPRRGFGLARARNKGANAAKHDILLFLDADILAEAELVAAHARWHQKVPDALTLGFCNYVSIAGISRRELRAHSGSFAELFAGQSFDVPWLERHMARTGDLTSHHQDLFRAVTGHNFAVSRTLFHYAGGFDESFTRYGGEDTEFAYRAQVRGALLVPVREALGWHQGRWMDDRGSKDRALGQQAEKLAQLIADPGFRRDSASSGFTVPRRVVTLEAEQAPADQVLRAINRLLADPADDLAVWLRLGGRSEAETSRIRGSIAEDSRVHIATPGLNVLDAFPASPIHIRLPATSEFRAGLVGRLEAALGDAATLSIPEAGVRVSRAWALNRARRHGGLAADYGGARTASARLLKRGPNGTPTGILRSSHSSAPATRHGLTAIFARIGAELGHVRGPRTAWRFIAWLCAAIRWRLGLGTSGAKVVHTSQQVSQARPDAPIGVKIATLGARSQAVFAASAQVRQLQPGAREAHMDIAFADSPDEAAGLRVPRVFLDEHTALAVPAFDPALDNPMGWVRDVEARVLSLGPPKALPKGSKARSAVGFNDRDALLHCQHLEDCAAFHPDASHRAGVIARLAARGVPVRVTDPDAELQQLLGAELGRLICTQTDLADIEERETLSIAMRRAALRGHSLAARARQVCRAAGVAEPALPLVSVLLVTRRPPLLDYAIANIARQGYPRLELVLALHGDGFDSDFVRGALQGFGHPVRMLRAESGQPLGSVLNSAVRAATGDLLAKMDDDDAYGSEHLWDLVLAQEYSGATLVGKFPANVYLARSDQWVQARRVPGETWSRSITGGTMLIARADLDTLGGWRELPRHVDKALVEDVADSGGSVYRTHSQGYVLVRHGQGHTWRRDDAEFLQDAQTATPGWPRGLAGMSGVPPPPPIWAPSTCPS